MQFPVCYSIKIIYYAMKISKENLLLLKNSNPLLSLEKYHKPYHHLLCHSIVSINDVEYDITLALGKEISKETPYDNNPFEIKMLEFGFGREKIPLFHQCKFNKEFFLDKTPNEMEIHVCGRKRESKCHKSDVYWCPMHDSKIDLLDLCKKEIYFNDIATEAIVSIEKV